VNIRVEWLAIEWWARHIVGGCISTDFLNTCEAAIDEIGRGFDIEQGESRTTEDGPSLLFIVVFTCVEEPAYALLDTLDQRPWKRYLPEQNRLFLNIRDVGTAGAYCLHTILLSRCLQ
jgi:hypothetical protein